MLKNNKIYKKKCSFFFSDKFFGNVYLLVLFGQDVKRYPCCATR